MSISTIMAKHGCSMHIDLVKIIIESRGLSTHKHPLLESYRGLDSPFIMLTLRLELERIVEEVSWTSMKIF